MVYMKFSHLKEKVSNPDFVGETIQFFQKSYENKCKENYLEETKDFKTKTKPKESKYI